MTNMTADEVKAAITAALATGHTEIKLTGELSKIGMGSGQVGAFAIIHKSRNATSAE